MKKVILLLAVAISSVLMMAQTNQITWVNGRAVLGQSISSIDSIKYGTIEDADQLVLWLPKTIVVHDTVIVHDTIIINDCGNTGNAPAGVEMVDLGLPSGIKWANMNVGATNPEEYGDHFAWGETSPKTTYDWSTYKWYNGSRDTQTKYCIHSEYGYNGFTDGKTVLDPEDDAAHVNWGGNWRMPTKAEQEELLDTANCVWTWTSNYNSTGVAGYIVTSTRNSNTIFLPASGYRSSSSLYGVGSVGHYWSSSLHEGDSREAYFLGFSSSSVGWGSDPHDYGKSVRPVCQ